MKENIFFKREEDFYIQVDERIQVHAVTNFPKNEFNPDKKLFIFNYGLVCNHQHWKHQLPFFDELDCQILIHDYRFHHKSTAGENILDCNFQNIVNDMAQLVETIGAKEVILLGHSMGVNICLEFAKAFSSRTKAMVLISGTVLPPHSIMFDSNITEVVTPYLKMIQTNFPQLFKSFWENSHKSQIIQKVVLKGGFNPKNVPQEFVEVYLRKMGELPYEIFLHLLDEMRNQDILSHLDKINCPNLIVGGDKDKVIPNFLQFILSDNLPNSEMYILKNGSHVPQVDFPEYLNERIERFFRKYELLV